MKLNSNDIEYIITEAIKRLSESVYMDKNKVNSKKKEIGLTYANGNWSKGNLNPQDTVKTDKMENQNGGDTYMVPLKNGIMSYNITSINGNNVMHYFKRLFDKKPTNVNVLDPETKQKEEYELTMAEQEKQRFLKIFKNKVEKVIQYQTSSFLKENPKQKIEKVCIYPVPSTSKFNTSMAKELANLQILNLPVEVIDARLLVKDLRNLERDEDFINKNKEYYNCNLGQTLGYTINDYVTSNINRQKKINELSCCINAYNEFIKRILYNYNNYKVHKSETTLQSLVRAYMICSNAWKECLKYAVYEDPTSPTGTRQIQGNKIAKIRAYSKGPSIETRSNNIWELVKGFVYNKKSHIDNKPYVKIPIQYMDPTPFEIKGLSNPERMALKNVYNPNTDEDFVQQEVSKTLNSVFVIFDDNLSGGATLSDICYQCTNLGIKNLIPITFGKMKEQWSKGVAPVIIPTNDNNEKGQFNI